MLVKVRLSSVKVKFLEKIQNPKSKIQNENSKIQNELIQFNAIQCYLMRMNWFAVNYPLQLGGWTRLERCAVHVQPVADVVIFLRFVNHRIADRRVYYANEADLCKWAAGHFI